MRSLTSSWSLCGLAGHKVTAVVTMVMCHFLLTFAQHTVPEDEIPKKHTLVRSVQTEVDDDQAMAESANRRAAAPSLRLAAQKRLMERGMMSPELYKRFIQGFVASRGKRTPLMDDFMHSRREASQDDALLSKRFVQGFVGSRGKRLLEGAPLESKRFLQGFVGSRGKRVLGGGGGGGASESKRYAFQAGSFHAGRGRRYLPVPLPQAGVPNRLFEKRGGY